MLARETRPWRSWRTADAHPLFVLDMTWRLKALLAAIAAAGAAGAGYAYFGDEGAASYRTEEVVRGALSLTVSATGTVNAVALVQVGSQVSGQIRELHADFNSLVRRGAVIARIAPETFAARVDEASAELEMARAGIAAAKVQLARARADAEHARAQAAVLRAQSDGARVAAELAGRELARKMGPGRSDFVAAAERERAQADLDRAAAALAAAQAQERAQAASIAAAQAAALAAEVHIQVAQGIHLQKEAGLRHARVDLDRTEITAPIEGIVVERNVDVGQTVAASLQAPTLFTIAQDLARLQVESYIDEADIGRIALGQTASFTVASFPGQPFAGEVVQIRKAPQLVQNVVTYIVVISARNDQLKLLPGMTANVHILTDRLEGIVKVPNAALRFRPPRPEAREAGRARRTEDSPPRAGQVFTLGPDDELQPVRVRLGASDGTFTHVLDGALAAGDRVVVGIMRAPKAGRRLSLLPRY
ncbi:MAG: efflux RND transporter periplasmic adaptor subunit [Pseudomonadota bacterium]